MPPRLRKFVGMIMLIALVVLYAMIATTIAVARLGESPWWIHMLYFAGTGILWVVPAMFLIRWMEKPVKGGPAAKP
jgi:hypothetical protein